MTIIHVFYRHIIHNTYYKIPKSCSLKKKAHIYCHCILIIQLDGVQKYSTFHINKTTFPKMLNDVSQINTMGVTSGVGTAYPSGVPEFISGFQWGKCYSIFKFMCMFCRSLFVPLSCYFWPLRCLFFIYIRIQITPLISSNSSNHCLLSPQLYGLFKKINFGKITLVFFFCTFYFLVKSMLYNKN